MLNFRYECEMAADAISIRKCVNRPALGKAYVQSLCKYYFLGNLGFNNLEPLQLIVQEWRISMQQLTIINVLLI